MTLKDIKVGMLVKLRCEDHCNLVMPSTNDADQFIITDGCTRMSSSSFNEDLSYNGVGSKNYSIERVYDPVHSVSLDPVYRTHLWTWNTPVKMTLREIECELGYHIEIVEE